MKRSLWIHGNQLLINLPRSTRSYTEENEVILPKTPRSSWLSYGQRSSAVNKQKLNSLLRIMALLIMLLAALHIQNSNAQEVDKNNTFARPPANNSDAKIDGTINWEQKTLDITLSFDLRKANIRLPAGRSQAEALLDDEFAFYIESLLMNVQADSSSTLGDLINRSELSTASFVENTQTLPPVLSTDLSAITGRASVTLAGIARELMRHSRPRTIIPPLIPIPVRDYTGIIIIADDMLPIHGRHTSARVVPCVFPKIWDSEMNQIYGRDSIDPNILALVRYTSRESITRAVPSGLDPEVEARVGNNPLRIMARGVFGAVPTDPIIDKEDALIILSSENNRRLLQQGRVAIVLDKEQLNQVTGNR